VHSSSTTTRLGDTVSPVPLCGRGVVPNLASTRTSVGKTRSAYLGAVSVNGFGCTIELTLGLAAVFVVAKILNGAPNPRIQGPPEA
jgi:hypothetical protein